MAAIGRTLIPRYFRTIFEGGVTELNYQLRHHKESFHQTSITLDCDQCTMVTQHGKPMYTKVSQPASPARTRPSRWRFHYSFITARGTQSRKDRLLSNPPTWRPLLSPKLAGGAFILYSLNLHLELPGESLFKKSSWIDRR